MKVGASSLYLTLSPFSELVKAIERSGVGFWEIVDEDSLRLDRRRARKLAELRASLGVEYSVHAPYSDINIAAFNPRIREATLRVLERSLELAASIEARVWIFHPGFRGPLSPMHPGEDLAICARSMERLLKAAEDLGVDIAVENMPGGFGALLCTVEDFKRFYEEFGCEGVGIALDVGHANTIGQLGDFVRELGHRIAHVHAHDNDGTRDAHLQIGEGSVEWRAFLGALKSAGFDGAIVVETASEPFEGVVAISKILSEL